MILADSSIWIAVLKGDQTAQTEQFAAAARDHKLIVGDLVLLEVLQGARNDSHARLLERTMHQYPLVTLLDGKLSIRAAANFRLLRSRGVTVKRTVDLIIATYCIEHDHILLHRDKDYAHFQRYLGLRAI